MFVFIISAGVAHVMKARLNCQTFVCQISSKRRKKGRSRFKRFWHFWERRKSRMESKLAKLFEPIKFKTWFNTPHSISFWISQTCSKRIQHSFHQVCRTNIGKDSKPRNALKRAFCHWTLDRSPSRRLVHRSSPN